MTVERKRVRAKAAAATQDAPSPAANVTSATPADGNVPTGTFPIVGVGASAGGLEALEAFFAQVPPTCGIGFVVVQHLDPTHEGMLAELLQRVTTMPVFQIAEGMRVVPGSVYVIPPNANLSITRGVLHLAVPESGRRLRLPIDTFFESLAADAATPPVGVILSGMGSDGTIGLKAIKARGGVAFVQDPASAKFDGMPTSAIAAGLADVVGAADELPEAIIARLSTPAMTPGAARPIPAYVAPFAPEALEEIFTLLRARSGHDFSQYKTNTIFRRVERRMIVRQIEKVEDYITVLKETPEEVDILFKELLIGVTNFFRDSDTWDAVKTAIVDMLGAARPADQPLRAWVAGCSTGEEAYSLAIVCREALDALPAGTNSGIQVFATDIDRDAVDRARSGVYPKTIAGDMSPERLKRFFVESEHGYQIIRGVRESVVFAPHDVTTDPPFTKLDIVTCRNVLIYLTADAQHKLMPRFHHALRPGGLLLLGSSETVGAQEELFATVDGKARLYRRLESAAGAKGLTFGPATRSLGETPPHATAARGAATVHEQAQQLLLRHYTPSAVFTNPAGDILFVSGRTGKYLEPAAGKANWNLFAMARDGLREELGAGFRKALRSKHSVTRRGVRVETGEGVHAVDVTIQPLDEPASLRGMLAVVFADVPLPTARPRPAAAAHGAANRPTSARMAALIEELAHAQRDVRAQRDDMQQSQEELSALNEELQSSNEELQSTNEELTTSKEEMQSMNEELQTLNHELQARVDSLSHLTNDMKNLLDNTEIATVFLDGALKVRLFTAGATRVFSLIAGDVGRPIADFASALDYPGLVDDAREVLRTLAVHERPAATRSGGWMLVRIMPYRTLDNMVDGVTITFSDITAAHEREDRLHATQAGLEQHIEAQDRRIERAERQELAAADDVPTPPSTTPPLAGDPHPTKHQRRSGK